MEIALYKFTIGHALLTKRNTIHTKKKKKKEKKRETKNIQPSRYMTHVMSFHDKVYQFIVVGIKKEREKPPENGGKCGKNTHGNGRETL